MHASVISGNMALKEKKKFHHSLLLPFYWLCNFIPNMRRFWEETLHQIQNELEVALWTRQSIGKKSEKIVVQRCAWRGAMCETTKTVDSVCGNTKVRCETTNIVDSTHQNAKAMCETTNIVDSTRQNAKLRCETINNIVSMCLKAWSAFETTKCVVSALRVRQDNHYY